MRQLQKRIEQPARSQNGVALLQPAPKDTVEYMDFIAMYEDGICQVRPDKFSITVSVSDINYQAARLEDKKIIFASYGELLHSLDIAQHLQITIRNYILDQKTFKDNLFISIPEVDDGLNEFRSEMNEVFFDKAMEGQNGVLREKYFTLSVTANNITEARQKFPRIESDFMEKLRSMGCTVSKLTGVQRLRLIHSYTRPEEPFNFQYSWLLGEKLSTKHFIAPTSLDFSAKNTFQCGKKYEQVLVLRDLPSRINDQLLSNITDLPFALTVSIHIDRMDQAKAQEHIRTQIAFMEGEQASDQSKAFQRGYDTNLATPVEMRRLMKGAKQLLRSGEEGDEHFFSVTLLIHVTADSEEELDSCVLQICSVCAQRSCTPVPLTFRQREGFNSVIPIGCNSVPISRTLTTNSTAIFVPFTTQELYEPDGHWYGLNQLSSNMIFVNRLGLDNANGFRFGPPGSGKSMGVKIEIINVLLKDPTAEVIVIDPSHEYVEIAKRFGGEHIHLAPGSPQHINAMDISDDYGGTDDDPLRLKTEFILAFVQTIARGSLSPAETSIVNRACLLCYRDFFAKTGKPCPTLRDFYNILLKQPEPAAKNIALALEQYIDGSLDVFAQETNVQTQKRFVVYDTRDLGNTLKAPGMLVVLDHFMNRLMSNFRRGIKTWLYVEEIQTMFENKYCTDFFSDIWARARKWGGVPTAITQNMLPIIHSEKGSNMLSNSDFIVLYKIGKTERDEIAKALQLSNKQLSFVTNASRGCGLLIAGGAIVPFTSDFPRDTNLYRMMTTRPDEWYATNAGLPPG